MCLPMLRFACRMIVSGMIGRCLTIWIVCLGRWCGMILISRLRICRMSRCRLTTLIGLGLRIVRLVLRLIVVWLFCRLSCVLIIILVILRLLNVCLIGLGRGLIGICLVTVTVRWISIGVCFITFRIRWGLCYRLVIRRRRRRMIVLIMRPMLIILDCYI